MKRSHSLPGFEQAAEGDETDRIQLSRQNSMDDIAEEELSCRIERALPIDAAKASYVMREIRNVLGSDDLDSVDLSTLSEDDVRRLTTLQQEANLVEAPPTVTWQSLSYKKDGKLIFQRVSGFLKPGMMTCCMGTSDSGVTSLLKVLASRYPRGVVSGVIRVAGEVSSFEKRKRYLSYVPFEDLHVARMTVKEAIEFSVRVRASPLVPSELLRLRVRLILHLLRLSHRANSRIGDAILRGISGGERRRLSVGLEVAAGRPFMFMDSPTNGLDSCSAQELGIIARDLANCGRSSMMALTQVGPALFGLFDYVLLMCRGECVFFGPRTHAEPYFLSLGYERPANKSVPDFLAAIIDNPAKFYRGADPERAPMYSSQFGNAIELLSLGSSSSTGPTGLRGGTTSRLCRSFRSSRLHEALGQILWAEASGTGGHSRRHALDLLGGFKDETGNSRHVSGRQTRRQKNDPTSAMDAALQKPSMAYQISMCIERETKLMRRDKTKTIGRLVRGLLMGVLIGFAFFSLDASQAGAIARLGAMATVTGFIGFEAVTSIPTFFSSRAVFFNQRNSGYFQAWIYSIALFITELPIAITQSMLFSISFYGLAGFRGGVFSQAFFIFFVLVTQLNMIGRACAILISNLLQEEGVAYSALILLSEISFMYSGFYLRYSTMNPLAGSLYHMSFFTRVLKALAINELAGKSLQCMPGEICRWDNGDDLLTQYSMTGQSVGTLVMWNFLFLAIFQIGGLLAMMYLNFESGAGDNDGDGAVEADDEDEDDNSEAGSQGVDLGSRYVLPVSGGVQLDQAYAPKPMHLEFREICYEVDGKKLLNNISGHVTPGMMVSLLGPSGAGKSTLLDSLAGRKTTGTLSGRLIVNGRLQKDIRGGLEGRIGYVEQFDSLVPGETVGEAVANSAALRLNAPLEQRQLIVEETLEKLGLLHVRNRLVSDSLSAETRKMTSIAVELVARPSCLFLDEPTTGLDSASALNIIEILRNISSDVPVLLTVHQPSAELFDAFNWLLLMRRGGFPAYFGRQDRLLPLCAAMGVGTFNSSTDNLAEFALKYVCADDAPSLPFSEATIRYDENVLNCETSDDTSKPVVVEPPCEIAPVSVWRQFTVLVRRAWLARVRDRATLLMSLLTYFALGLMIGFMYFGSLPATFAGAMSRAALVFSNVMYLSWLSASRLPRLFAVRASYYRELSVKSYGVCVEFFASCTADLPISALQTLLLSVPIYLLGDFALDAESILTYMLCMMVTSEASSGCLRMIAALSPSPMFAAGITSATYTLFTLVGGFLITPSALSWMGQQLSRGSLCRYAFSFALTGAIHDGVQLDCSEQPGLTDDECSEAILGHFDMDSNDRWTYFGVLVSLLIGFRVIALIALKSMRHIRR